MMHLLESKNKAYIYLIIFFLISSINTKHIYKLEDYLKIVDIKVVGLKENQNQKIKKDLIENKNRNIFYNQSLIKKLINKNNLVHDFNVKKIYPNKLLIQLNETKFIAKAFINNKFLILGSNKKYIDSYLGENINLPTIFGKFNEDSFIELFNELNNKNFDLKGIESFFYFPSRRWDIKFNNGLLLKLSDKKWEISLDIAKSLINDSKQNNLKVIDLRTNDKVFLR